MKKTILEFSECFRIDGWSPRDGQINDGPAMLKGEFMVNKDQMTNVYIELTFPTSSDLL